MLKCVVLPIRNTDEPRPALFLGLLPANGCDRCGADWPTAVVRYHDSGLLLEEVHLSRITQVSPA